jgi:hypothetical protein
LKKWKDLPEVLTEKKEEPYKLALLAINSLIGFKAKSLQNNRNNFMID